jgi:hypothetical protein
MLTSGHGDQGTWQVGVKWISARPPFKNDACSLVDQKVQDGQVDVELLLFLVVHPPSQDMQTLSWLAVAVMEAVERVSQFLLQVSHGRIVDGSCGQHGEWRIISGQDKAQEGLSRSGGVDAAM